MACDSHADLMADVREIRRDVSEIKGDLLYIKGKFEAKEAASKESEPDVKVWFGPGLQKWAVIIATLLSLLGVGFGVSANSEPQPLPPAASTLSAPPASNSTP